MKLRAARIGDAPEICAIANQLIRDTLSTFTTQERSEASVAAHVVERGAAFQVAEFKGEVVGFATYFPFRSGPGYGFTREHSVQLRPDARGRGTGRALMARLEQVAQAHRVHVLVAAISGANPGAVAFHRRIGFAEVGRLTETGFKEGRWLDLILMQKILPPAPESRPDTALPAE